MYASLQEVSAAFDWFASFPEARTESSIDRDASLSATAMWCRAEWQTVSSLRDDLFLPILSFFFRSPPPLPFSRTFSLFLSSSFSFAKTLPGHVLGRTFLAFVLLIRTLLFKTVLLLYIYIYIYRFCFVVGAYFHKKVHSILCLLFSKHIVSLYHSS